jgi:uroporphyrin-3 C-methyltransferase
VNTEISGNESETPESPVEESTAGKNGLNKGRSPRSGASLAFFAFLVAMAALAVSGWIWWQDQASPGQEEQRVVAEISRLENSDSKLALELNQVRDQLNTLSAGDAGAEIKAVQQGLQADRSKMEQVESALGKQASMARSLQAASESLHGRLLAAEAALAGMSTRELDAGGELDLAEVDYLLRLANERLKLFSDPEAAGQALELADMHLAALDNPMYLGIRQDIATARRELGNVSIPDYVDISSRLDTIQQEIAVLPFKQDASSKDSPEQASGDGWWDKVKGVFSNLVTVRRSTDEENQRISLQDRDYIRQSAWLQLEVAQLALMRRDQQAFRASLQRVKASLSGWFDSGDRKYQAVLQKIDDLNAIEIQVEVPDITAPWSTLRLLRAAPARPLVAPETGQPTAPVEPSDEDGKG